LAVVLNAALALSAAAVTLLTAAPGPWDDPAAPSEAFSG
jgi:hypothetical protein